jgi:hypothetical protein
LRWPDRTLDAQGRRDARMTRAEDYGAGAAGTEEWRS